jgi:hypothetical protein
MHRRRDSLAVAVLPSGLKHGDGLAADAVQPRLAALAAVAAAELARLRSIRRIPSWLTTKSVAWNSV